MRLFHPFARPRDVPNLVGRTGEWIDEQAMGARVDGGEGEFYRGAERDARRRVAAGDDDDDDDDGVLGHAAGGGAGGSDDDARPSSCLTPFPVTLDSMLILPHWEVLDARIEALEERMPRQATVLGETPSEREDRERRAEGMRLVEAEERGTGGDGEEEGTGEEAAAEAGGEGEEGEEGEEEGQGWGEAEERE